jgi:TctA family transporter
MVMSQNDPVIFFERPVSAALMVAAVLMLAGPLFGSVGRLRHKLLDESEG